MNATGVVSGDTTGVEKVCENRDAIATLSKDRPSMIQINTVQHLRIDSEYVEYNSSYYDS